MTIRSLSISVPEFSAVRAHRASPRPLLQVGQDPCLVGDLEARALSAHRHCGASRLCAFSVGPQEGSPAAYLPGPDLSARQHAGARF